MYVIVSQIILFFGFIIWITFIYNKEIKGFSPLKIEKNLEIDTKKKSS